MTSSDSYSIICSGHPVYNRSPFETEIVVAPRIGFAKRPARAVTLTKHHPIVSLLRVGRNGRFFGLFDPQTSNLQPLRPAFEGKLTW
jgi:hypothetical protein